MSKREHKGKYLDNEGVRIYYEITEGKPWLVFLHGTTVNHTVFHHQIDYFAEKGYGTLAIDQRGDGKSSKPLHEHEYTLAHYNTDLERILSQEDIDETTLIGHSKGAMVAANAAYWNPKKVRAVVMIAGSYDFSRSLAENRVVNEFLRRFGVGALRCINDFFFRDSRAGYNSHADNYIDFSEPEFAERGFMADIKFGKEIYSHASNKEWKAMTALSRAAMKKNIEMLLPGIEQPTLIIHGELDPAVNQFMAYKLARRIPGATSPVTVFGAGHQAMLHSPKYINRIIEDFVIDVYGLDKDACNLHPD